MSVYCTAKLVVSSAAIALVATSMDASPIQTLTNLTSVTIFEATNTVHAIDFAPNAPELLARLPDPLGDASRDFSFFAGENYDAFYSRADGTPDVNGSFLTIEGVLTPGVLGGGMNITGVRLNFSNGSSPLADFVSSFQAVCDFGGCVAGSESFAVDGNLSFSSIPLLGATLNYPTDLRRMRLTVGWTGISVAEPVSLLLSGLGLAGLALHQRSKQH